MDGNQGAKVTLSRETANLVVDLLGRSEDGRRTDERKEAVCDLIKAALSVPQQPRREMTKEEARVSLERSMEKLAQAQSALAEALDHGSESDQGIASAAVTTEENEVQDQQAAYEVAAGDAMHATAQIAEGDRRVAYAKSKKAHDEALLALQGYEPLAQEISKLFRILSFHADLAMADVEAADAARISPHVENAADHLERLIQEQKLGHADAVTKHALTALRELAAHARG